MQDLKLAIIQTSLHWQDKDANLSHFESIFNRLEPCDLVILPEMFTTGFTMDASKMSEPSFGPTHDWMLEQAKKLNAAIMGSYIVSENNSFFNRMLLVKPTGETTFYNKRHLFRMANEDAHFKAGAERVICEYLGWRINLQICYDLRFPVWSRNLSDYDLLVYVANWPAARKVAWQTLLRARAIENLSYVAGVNRVGLDGNEIAYAGDSTVIDFKGSYLYECKSEVEEIGYAVLNFEELQAFRAKFPAHLDADRFEIKK